MKNSIHLLLKSLATLGPLGYLPAAPGTWGSAAALLFLLMLNVSPAVHFLMILAGTLIGILAAHTAETLLREKDSRHIIIDEFVGFFAAAFFLPPTFSYLIPAFLLFRFFDILKPFPIRKLEKVLGGGIGIMADDIAAAVFTNIILQIWKISY